MQVFLAGAVPLAFGALCGWLLGVDKTAYLIASVLAIGGGYFAGKEHDGAAEGALRGLVGGSLFGAGILLVHEATGKEAKADLPHPAALLLVITVGAGILLGALGGRSTHQQIESGEERPGINLKHLKWPEFVGFAGAGLLLGSMFLPWFSTSCTSEHPFRPEGCNANSTLNGLRGEFNAFQTYAIMDILLVAACIAPFVLAYLLVREAPLSWAPGEVTMIVGMTAGALIILNGIILGRPGDSVEISIEPGYILGLIGANMILAGGLVRQARYSRARKPPGVL
ncbi:MAG TPA: hypothetical protein VJT75_04700 [Thermoleophilaceae bacterium]|nr:hypothetical protein [Thermoleophilaceae bacterium]